MSGATAGYGEVTADEKEARLHGLYIYIYIQLYFTIAYLVA